jgi:hypothetical protein
MLVRTRNLRTANAIDSTRGVPYIAGAARGGDKPRHVIRALAAPYTESSIADPTGRPTVEVRHRALRLLDGVRRSASDRSGQTGGQRGSEDLEA